MFWKRKLLLGKRETTYGTDAVPAAADAVVAFDVTIAPAEQQLVERRPATPWFRAADREEANAHIPLSFFVEAAGAGAAGTVPAYGWALRSAGFAETVNVGVDVQYLPVSTGFDASSVYWHMDGQRQRALGWRSAMVFEAMANEVPKFRFSGRALYTAITATAFPTPNFSAYRAGVVVNQANTPTVTLHGTAVILRELSIDLGQAVRYRNRPGSESVQQTDRAPSGRIVIEAPSVATKDWVAAARAKTLGALQLIHGVGAGAIVQVDCPQVKIVNPRWIDDEDIAGWEMDLNILPSAGDDEVKFTIK